MPAWPGFHCTWRRMNVPGGSSQVADNVGLLTYMHLVPDNGQVAGEAGLSSSLDSGVSVGLAVAGTARIIWAAAG